MMLLAATRNLLAVCLLLCSSLAFAAHPAEAFVETTSNDVLAILKRESRAGNEKVVRDQIMARVLPHFDFTRMTGLAVGKHWRSASPQQQQALTQEFKTLLIYSYANALTANKVDAINVKPVTSGTSDSGEVTVLTEVMVSGKKPITIDYRLSPSGSSWKVFDVMVAGASIVTTYRNSFNQSISQNGVDGLIKQLSDRNQQLAKGATGS